jgi:hypothetical protein
VTPASRRQFTVYILFPLMSSPAPDRLYHVIPFADPSEADAFLEALRRFLSYPAGSGYGSIVRPFEIWSSPPRRGGSVELYLTDGALEAAQAAFAPVPVSETRRGDRLPVGCALRIG